MASRKFKEVGKMSSEEKEKKMKELKLELVKSLSNSSKSIRTNEIKKAIARILTTNK